MTRLVLVIWWAAISYLPACADDVEIVLAPASGCESACGVADMSCVRYIQVRAGSALTNDVTTSCEYVGAGSMQSLCTHDLVDRIKLVLPDELTSIQVEGFESERGCADSTIFGGFVQGPIRSQVRVGAVCNLDCAARDERTYQVRVMNFERLTASECVAPNSIDSFVALLGIAEDRRRYSISPELNIVFKMFPEVNMGRITKPEGSLQFSGKSYEVSHSEGRCLGVELYDGTNWEVSCLNSNVSGNICGAEEDFSVTWLGAEMIARIDALWSFRPEPGWYYAGIVWDANSEAPLAGAVVSQLPPGVAVAYVDRVDNRLVERSLPVTGTSGMFILFGEGVGSIRVSAPGYISRDAAIVIATVSPASGAIPLERALTSKARGEVPPKVGGAVPESRINAAMMCTL